MGAAIAPFRASHPPPSRYFRFERPLCEPRPCLLLSFHICCGNCDGFATKDLDVQKPERRPLPGTTARLRAPRGDRARRVRSYVCFVADRKSKTWPHPTCSVLDEFLRFMRICECRMLGSCSRGLHEEDVTLRHILLRMRMGTEFRVYKQVLDAELTTIAATLQQATSVSLCFSDCERITDFGLKAFEAAPQRATSVSLSFIWKW